MGRDTGIGWCHHTFNPWWGCSRVSRACIRCYAEKLAARYGHNVWGKTAPRRELSDNYWRQPLHWNRDAVAAGERRRVFCASMADVFEDHPQLPPLRERLWRLVEATPGLDWLLLTKRPENMLSMTPWGTGRWPEHVWAGATVENNERALAALPHLVAVDAAVRFVSYEPAVEAVDFGPWLDRLDWLIVGGESGGGAERMDPAWARAAAQACGEHGSSFFFKQAGNMLAREWGCVSAKGDDPAEWPEEFQVQQVPHYEVAA